MGIHPRGATHSTAVSLCTEAGLEAGAAEPADANAVPSANLVHPRLAEAEAARASPPLATDSILRKSKQRTSVALADINNKHLMQKLASEHPESSMLKIPTLVKASRGCQPLRLLLSRKGQTT